MGPGTTWWSSWWFRGRPESRWVRGTTLWSMGQPCNPGDDLTVQVDPGDDPVVQAVGLGTTRWSVGDDFCRFSCEERPRKQGQGGASKGGVSLGGSLGPRVAPPRCKHTDIIVLIT